MLSAIESIELTVAEDELSEVRNNGRPKVKHSSTDTDDLVLVLYMIFR